MVAASNGSFALAAFTDSLLLFFVTSVFIWLSALIHCAVCPPTPCVSREVSWHRVKMNPWGTKILETVA